MALTTGALKGNEGHQMEVFAIRHKPTQAWMPARMFKQYGGWSHWEPEPVPEGHGDMSGYDKNPRIFFTKRSVQNALKAWVQGAWMSQTKQDGDWETGYHRVSAGPAPEKPVNPRKREDMEIVALELIGA